jgi:SAM-dependent methyltransferase
VLFLEDLDPDAVGDAGAHATHYEAVPVADFRNLLAQIPPDAIGTSTFVDVGAGMGRALLLASEYPFKQIVGVEVSPGLYEVAKMNLASARNLEQRSRDIRIVRADARMWEYPPGDLVVFLYNPFDATALQATLGAVLARRNLGNTWIVYHTPVERAILDQDTSWHLVAEVGDAAVYRSAQIINQKP